ncbi:fumarylacetoacetate hydrolase family protein [Arthrobacter sp. 92]|uniref:fumarylacetoacetate hydrolase family protein n=1 Tax=Arthrobacter sp. 92 TaxID=3418175 RepID=UPI003D09383A
MKFMRVGPAGTERLSAIHDGHHYSLQGLTEDLDGLFWVDGPSRKAATLTAGTLPEADIRGQRESSPTPRPGAVICAGQKYAAHAAESGAQAPDQQIIFLKTPNAVTGPNDAVHTPTGSAKTDWEAELGILIGQATAFLHSPEDEPGRIAGFVAVNGLSERTYQIEDSGGPWSGGKCVKEYCPVGPTLATTDELDASNLPLRSWVTGEPRQDSNTSDMIFDVNRMGHHLSQYMELEPGELILPGWRSQVGFHITRKAMSSKSRSAAWAVIARTTSSRLLQEAAPDRDLEGSN